MRISTFVIVGILVAGCSSSDRTPKPEAVAEAEPSGSKEPPTRPHYQLPPEGTKDLVTAVDVRRPDGGLVEISAAVSLPINTQVWVQLYTQNNKNEAVLTLKEHLHEDGILKTQPFELAKSGKYRLRLSAHFNNIWQSPAVRELVGDEGKKLPITALEPNDREFPSEGGSMESWHDIVVPLMSEKYSAIQKVKDSKLFVQDKGQAVDTVSEITKFYGPLGLRAVKWDAEEVPGHKWNVSLDHYWGDERKTAHWEFDSASQRVRYLDPEAKLLSWLPED